MLKPEFTNHDKRGILKDERSNFLSREVFETVVFELSDRIAET